MKHPIILLIITVLITLSCSKDKQNLDQESVKKAYKESLTQQSIIREQEILVQQSYEEEKFFVEQVIDFNTGHVEELINIVGYDPIIVYYNNKATSDFYSEISPLLNVLKDYVRVIEVTQPDIYRKNTSAIKSKNYSIRPYFIHWQQCICVLPNNNMFFSTRHDMIIRNAYIPNEKRLDFLLKYLKIIIKKEISLSKSDINIITGDILNISNLKSDTLKAKLITKYDDLVKYLLFDNNLDEQTALLSELNLIDSIDPEGFLKHFLLYENAFFVDTNNVISGLCNREYIEHKHNDKLSAKYILAIPEGLPAFDLKLLDTIKVWQ